MNVCVHVGVEQLLKVGVGQQKNAQLVAGFRDERATQRRMQDHHIVRFVFQPEEERAVVSAMLG